MCNMVEQLIGPDIGGHPVWNLRTKTPQDEATTVPWHQGTVNENNSRTKLPSLNSHTHVYIAIYIIQHLNYSHRYIMGVLKLKLTSDIILFTIILLSSILSLGTGTDNFSKQ